MAADADANVLAPLRQDANHRNGWYAFYRSGKAALNMPMRSFAARRRDSARTLLLMAPGWCGSTSAGRRRACHRRQHPAPARHRRRRHGRGGQHYLDDLGRAVP
ncbi:hypothetical protein [Xanthomonas sp. CFBP 8445]|uniref:hypothetical protein n=1 Tax=Xanthomonas sp. CFBP 8445 TaxID=2971236 RepID=UPI0021DF9785|nr:hypothetical protein [Xanthomonas sp. CFBP 8445]UYC12712.1 hypothetical protein NUG21_02925 [Xanthomonas sp. CFBP 8445]